jgi:transposase
VRLADRGVKSIRVVAEDLGIHETVLKRWRRELQMSKESGTRFAPGNGRARDEEIERLRRELATVKLERDLLKKAAAYFAQHTK